MQELNEDNFDRRVQFCETMLHAAAADSNLLHRIIWSDKATFHLNASFNRHKTVTVEKTVASVGVTGWAHIHINGIIGPFLYDNDSVNAANYLALLTNDFYSTLHAVS